MDLILKNEVTTIMQSSDMKSFYDDNYNVITKHYVEKKIDVDIFDSNFPSDIKTEVHFLSFLVDRRHVVEYKIHWELPMGVLFPTFSVAVGPAYFYVGLLWPKDSFDKFSLEVDKMNLRRNLNALDELILDEKRNLMRR